MAATGWPKIKMPMSVSTGNCARTGATSPMANAAPASQAVFDVVMKFPW
jgi:hypothetical protein